MPKKADEVCTCKICETLSDFPEGAPFMGRICSSGKQGKQLGFARLAAV